MNNEFKAGFEKTAGAYTFAINTHVNSFNTSAAAKRSKYRARHVKRKGNDYLEVYSPGSKGFLGFGKRPDKLKQSRRVIDNTSGQVNKDKNSSAIYFGK